MKSLATYRRGHYRAEFTHSGEGLLNNKFDPDEPGDMPLLRFSIHHKDATGPAALVPFLTYRTLLPLETPEKDLQEAAREFFETVKADGPEWRLEMLSWLMPSDSLEAPPQLDLSEAHT